MLLLFKLGAILMFIFFFILFKLFLASLYRHIPSKYIIFCLINLTLILGNIVSLIPFNIELSFK